MEFTADEFMWGGYLKFMVETGVVTLTTPPAEIAEMRAGFLRGLRGEPEPATP